MDVNEAYVGHGIQYIYAFLIQIIIILSINNDQFVGFSSQGYNVYNEKYQI